MTVPTSTARTVTSGDVLGLPAWARQGSDLVPGVPARVLQLADQLDAMADGLGSTDRLLQHVLGGGWVGSAAAGFARLMASLPAPYRRAAPQLRDAGGSVRHHAGVLAAAQHQADEALALDRRARALRSTPGSPTGGIVPPDAADALQRRALEQVEQARARVQGSGLRAAAALDRAADAAPDTPNAVVRLLHRAFGFQRSLQLGIIESEVATAKVAVMLSPTRALADPSGWWRDVRATERAMVSAASHPVDTAKAVVDPDLLRSDPGRWIGHLLPDLAMGAMTGGVGLAANRGVSVGVRLAELSSRGERLADIRAGITAGTATGRSRLRLRDLRGWSAVDRGRLYTLTPGQNLATRALGRDAAWAEHDLRARVLTVGRATGTDVVGLENAVKGGASLRRKVSEAAATRPLPDVLPDVNDTVRYTFVPATEAYAGAVADVIAGLRGQGMVLVKAKNFWGGARYRGLNLTLADPRTGRLLEVQVHTPGSWAATKATHDDYETWRVLADDDPRKALLDRRISRVFARVPEPPGLRELTDHLRRLPTEAAANRPPDLTSPQLRPAAVALAAAGAASSSGGAAAATAAGGDEGRGPLTTGAPAACSLSSEDGRRTGRHLEHTSARGHAGGQP